VPVFQVEGMVIMAGTSVENKETHADPSIQRDRGAEETIDANCLRLASSAKPCTTDGVSWGDRERQMSFWTAGQGYLRKSPKPGVE
jgi:hypothetical protein